MPLNTMTDLLIEQLNELHAAERHNVEVLPALARAASSPTLAAALRSYAEEATEHLSRLEGVFDDMGVSPRPPSRAESQGMRGLCQDCLTLANMSDAEPHVRDAAIIAVAQHVQHDKIAGYGCAKTWSSLLGRGETASQLQKTLEEVRRADRELTRRAESLNKAALAMAAG